MQSPAVAPPEGGRDATDAIREPVSHIPGLVRQLYELVHEFERRFPGRPFTPDGHLVGSIGEVLAAHHYGLTLLPCSAEAHDAVSATGLRVQVKATQGASVAMRSCCDHLIVLRLLRSGETEEIYNGPGVLAWEKCGAMQRNGQRPITLAKLRSLMTTLPDHVKLPRKSG